MTQSFKIGRQFAIDGNVVPPIDRDVLIAQEDAVPYPIPLSSCFVQDTGQPLPAAATGTKLTLAPGTFGTANPCLSAGDLKAAGATTRMARAVVSLPPEYVRGRPFSIRIAAGMDTTVADTTCTVDVEAFKVGRNQLVDGTDRVTTAAQSINSLTFAEKTFAVTGAGLAPGDQLDIRISLACNDAATATAVTPKVASIDLMLDIQG